jgi:hypothetical protein
MIELKRQWNSLTSRGKWTARGASFMAKVKATKLVWFPPTPTKAGKSAAATAKDATKKASRTTKKSTGTAKKAASRSKKATGS